jgi:3-oxoadipate enol-lactonase
VTDLRFEVAGKGPAVVLVHAGICDSRMWEPQFEAYALEFSVVRYDLRGFGRSPLPPEPYSHARDLLSLLDRVGAARAALVGVSLGGRVALEAAVAAPERVSALVLVAAALPLHPWSEDVERYGAEEEAALARGDLDAATELNVAFWLAGEAASEVRELVRVMQRRAFELQLPVSELAEEAPLVSELDSRLGEVRAPALVVTGEHDVGDFALVGDRLAGELPDARRATVPGAGHLPPLERPAAFDALVLPFLRDYAAR